MVSTTMARLQAGSVAVASAHTSLRTKACHSAMAQGAERGREGKRGRETGRGRVKEGKRGMEKERDSKKAPIGKNREREKHTETETEMEMEKERREGY